MSEAFELGDEPAGGAFGVALAEVVAAGLAVELTGGEHVPAGAKDGVLDGADRFAVPDSGALAAVERLQVGVLAAGRGHRGVLEGGVEPAAAFAGTPGALLARGAVVAGALPAPGGQVAGGGEDAHVGADLGEDVLRAAPPDAGDRAQELNRGPERGEALLDRVGEPVDLLVEEVEVGEDRSDQQRVQLIEAALERFLQRRQLPAQLALGQVSEDDRVFNRPASAS